MYLLLWSCENIRCVSTYKWRVIDLMTLATNPELISKTIWEGWIVKVKMTNLLSQIIYYLQMIISCDNVIILNSNNLIKLRIYKTKGLLKLKIQKKI